MIEVTPVRSKKERKQFIDFQYRLYSDDKVWVPPLKLERKELIDPQKNPYFENAKAQLFIAKREGQVVGRICAQVNDLHNKKYNEKTGHFGFYDCVDDQAVSKALFTAAENWLQEQGMDQIVGPFNLSINEESGVLIQGFDTPPYPYMPHNYSYYQKLIENCGYGKIKDLVAWSYDSKRPIPEPAMQIAQVVKEYPGLVVREVDMKNLERDVRIVADVFNSAWSKNWGFIPWTDAELKKVVKDFKMILEPKLALIAEVDGVPAAISIAFPNYHEAIQDLKGRLLPFGFIKFLYRLKARKIKTARLALLGIKKEFRHDILSGLSVYLYTEMHRRSKILGHQGGELSWTLDDNDKINNGISLMGGEPYKKYRIFQKPLSSPFQNKN